jgi:hypothetical protein
LVERHNRHFNHHVRPDLNEMLYVVIRLSSSLREDPRYAACSWSELVRETRRRLHDHLAQGIGYRERQEPGQEPGQ